MATAYTARLEEDAYGNVVEVVEQDANAVQYHEELIAYLQGQENDARNDTLNDERKVALEFYNGEPFGNEETGRSQVVTRDVAEVIDYMLASVLRTMVSGDRIVEFQAMADEDRDAVAEANEAVQQQFMNAQDGYRVLHDSLKAGLMEKTGAVKTFVEVRETRVTQEVDEAGLVALDEVVTIDSAEMLAEPTGIDMETGLSTGGVWRVSYVKQEPLFPDVPIPNEELLVARDSRQLSDGYHAHKVRKTVSDLRKMFGDVVDESLLGYDGRNAGSQLADARDYPQQGDSYRSGANRWAWLLEEYCDYDLDGDGITEKLRIQRSGRQIFSVEQIEDGLIEEWCPFPMQHRRVGQSLADKCMDIQLVRSVLLRQSLDNLYLSNVPRMLVPEASMGDTTVDDLLTVQPGALVRYIGAQPPTPLVTPFVAESSFQALEFMAGERESRTGITRMNQGLDADALNKTATGTAMMQAAGQQMEEYIARHFAEFIGRVFRKKYRLMRDYGQPFTVMLDGVLKQVNPSNWPDDIRVIVRAGLGTGRKEQRVQTRAMALQIMQAAAAGGSRTVTDENVYAMLKGLFQDMNLGSVHELLTDPSSLEPEEEPQDPKMMEVQAKAMIAAEEQQRKREESEANITLKAEEAAAELQFMREKAALEIELARDKAAAEEALAIRQQNFEMSLARDQMALQREQAAHKAGMDETSVSKKRPGGELDK